MGETEEIVLKQIEKKKADIKNQELAVIESKKELKVMQNNLYEIQTGRKKVTVDGVDYVKTENELLPIVHPKYGGYLTFLNEYTVLKWFYVANGHWEGMIVEVDGVKKLKILDTEGLRDIQPDEYLWLD